MTNLQHAVYVGHLEHLKGEGALIRPADKPGFVMAQFDTWHIFSDSGEHEHGDTGDLSHGWHQFPEGSFEVDE